MPNPAADNRSFTVERLVRDSLDFFGLPSHLAAGGLAEFAPSHVMTVSAAYTEILSWTGDEPPPDPGGGGVAVKVGTTLAALGEGDADGALGLIRLGAWPNQHEELLRWNDGANKWVGDPHVVLTQGDSWAMDLGNKSGAKLTGWCAITNPIPYAKHRTMLNGAQAANSGTLTVTDTTGTVGKNSLGAFPSAGTLTIRDNIISYTGKTATTFTGCTLVSGTGGTMPDDCDVVSGVTTGGYGFVPSALLFAAEMWAAGFRLQEKLTGMMNGEPGATPRALSIAPYWYEYDDLDGYVPPDDPPSGGLGLSATLIGTTNPGGGDKESERLFYFAENLWGDWASAGDSGKVPTKRYLVPRLYGKMPSGAVDTGEVLDVVLRVRWIG